MPEVLADVMKSCPPCVDAELKVEHLEDVFHNSGADRALVVEQGQLVGVVLAAQLNKCVCRCAAATARDLAGRHVLTASERTPIAKAFESFQSGVDRFVVVLRDGVPVGAVRPRDLFGWMGEQAGGHPIRRPHFLGHTSESASQTVPRPAG